MATYQGAFKTTHGQRISVHYPANAAGFLPVMTDGTNAGSTDEKVFYVSQDCLVTDFVTTQTAGVMELWSNGAATGYTIETTADFAVATVNRPFVPFRLRRGVPYQWKQIVAGAA